MKKVKTLVVFLLTIVILFINTNTIGIVYADQIDENPNYVPSASQQKRNEENDKKSTWKNNLQDSAIDKAEESKKSNGLGTFDPEQYAPQSTSDVTGGNELLRIGNNILGWINLFATIISVIVIGIIGIKYMVGSIEERAEYKKNMKPYIIGCVLIFGITTFLDIIVNIVQALN